MWHAVDFTSDKASKASFTDDTVLAVVRRMKEHGVLVSAIGPSAFEMAPPLIATRAQLEHTAVVAAAAIDEITTERGLT
jgi:putrescine aminotransferase